MELEYVKVAVGIGENVALLLCLTLFYGVAVARLRNAPPVTRGILLGLLFGGAALLGMLATARFQHGAHDGREVVVLAAAFFGGPIAGAIAGVSTSLFRLTLAGEGMLAGASMTLVAAVVGVVMRRRHDASGRPMGPRVFAEVACVYSVLSMIPALMLETWSLQLIAIVFSARLAVHVVSFLLVATLLSYEDRRREAEEALSVSVDRYAVAAAGANDGLWDWDLATDRVFYSARWGQMLGLSEAALRPMPGTWLERVHPEDGVAVRAAIDAHLSGETDHLEVEHRLRHADGEYRWVLVRGLAVRLAGQGAARLAGSATDLTERKQAALEREAVERRLLEAQRLESMGVLAGGVAHDFNNLLTGILGSASLLSYQTQDPVLRASAQRIETSASRAAELCRKLLDYSGRGSTDSTPIDIDDLVRETCELSGSSGNRSAAIDMQLTAATAQVKGDATQLRQILMNLVANALDALEDKGGGVFVRTRVADCSRRDLEGLRVGAALPPGQYVEIEVEDDGCGMPPDVRERIFDPFFTTKPHGRGLGLASVLGIVRSHGGGLDARSEPGEGTTFRLLLPLAPVEPAVASAAVAAAEVSPPAEPAGQHVLVVDDEEMIRELASVALKDAGYAITTACDGLEAVERLEAGLAPDLVLLDIKMPRLDGAGALRRLRGAGNEVPVLLMSGFHEESVREELGRQQHLGVLQKPFRATDLVLRIRAALAEREPPAEVRAPAAQA